MMRPAFGSLDDLPVLRLVHEAVLFDERFVFREQRGSARLLELGIGAAARLIVSSTP
jgi:hypothetical protein